METAEAQVIWVVFEAASRHGSDGKRGGDKRMEMAKSAQCRDDSNSLAW